MLNHKGSCWVSTLHLQSAQYDTCRGPRGYSGVCVGDRTARDSGGLTVPTFMGNKRKNLAPRLLKQAGSFGIS